MMVPPGSFASPHLIDAVLAFILVEGVCLVWRRVPVGLVVRILLPGICLMLALRAALAGAAWPWVPVTLAASFAAHVADLRTRLRR